MAYFISAGRRSQTRTKMPAQLIAELDAARRVEAWRRRKLTRINFRRTLAALEKQNDDYYLTKTILRSFGCGLHRKPRIFQPFQKPTERAPIGRGLACLLERRFAVPRCRAR